MAPKSTELNPFKYFLWGYFNDRVYNTLLKTLYDLRIRIERKINLIESEILKIVFFIFEKMRCFVISSVRRHIEIKGIIFCTIL